MADRLKTNEIPQSAQRLYIKLYCERKGNKSKETINTAKKSWSSLSLKKRNIFYETTRNRNLINLTHSLCKSKIYLKEKYPNQNKERLDQDSKEEGEDILLSSNTGSHKSENAEECDYSTETIPGTIQNSICFEEDFEKTINNTEVSRNNSALECNTTSLDGNNVAHNSNNYSECDSTNAALDSGDTVSECNNAMTLDTEPKSPKRSNFRYLDDIVDRESDIESNPAEDSNSRESTTKTLSEPIPPTVMNGRELYNLLKKHDAPDFNTLKRIDREHYNAAVRNLKKEYIKKYTQFLESLSKQELFDHYVKTIY